MKAYRIAQARFAQSAEQMLDGRGAYENGGRWNSPGVRAVYLAETLSLAALEILVHIPRGAVMARYRFLEVSVDETRLIEMRDVPANGERRAGDHLLEGGELGFMAASVINPLERNLILNPDHPEFADHVSWGEISDFPIDPRLLK